MPSRERSRSRTSTEEPTDSFEQPTPFEVGETTLDLDDVSDDELEDLYFEDDTEESSLFNLPTVTGLTLILAGTIYLLSELGVWTGLVFSDLVLPWLVGIVVILLGFGLLTWRSSSGEDEGTSKTKKKAVEADTGETKVVEEPGKSGKKKLMRSRTDKKLLGVCGGIAEYLNLDSTLVRIAFVVGVIGSGGPFVLGYLLLALVMPKEPPLSPEERLSIIRDELDDA